jgi:selenocysteine-specific elongation factor
VSRAIHPVMVGTAGHIDHGKSSLVRALTGTDPDRLKEEKERGLTIDLGFASFRLGDGRLVGMVDVPGHERFVKNMVAGSTALDLALLVVAADDSVMPQTIEHLEILNLLGVHRGVCALTKVDLVDPDLADLAEDEIRETLAGTPLEDIEILRVSSTTGAGIEALHDHLQALALSTPLRGHDGPFRMPIQRVFKLEGIGTVVTGIPVRGAVRVGDEIEFLPGGGRAKVRALQAFGGAVDRAVAGHSAALSVPDARDLGLSRGCVAATPGVFHAGDHVDVELEVLSTSPRLDHRTEVRFHVGTAEALGVISLLEHETLGPGSVTVARLLLQEAVACAHGDRFLLRTMNPPRTVGGGTILQVSEGRRYRRRRLAEQVRALVEAGNDPVRRAVEAVRQAGPVGKSLAEVAGEISAPTSDVQAILETSEDVHWHPRGRRAFDQRLLDSGIESVAHSVDRILKDRPSAASIVRAQLRTTHDFPAELKEAVLDEMAARGQVRSGASGRLLFVGRLRPLPLDEQQSLDRIVGHCEGLGFRPPTPAEASAELGIPSAKLADLVARAIDEARLEQVGDHVYGASVIRRALVSIRDNCLANAEVLDIPKLRDDLGTSRKYLIPLLEHVDALGLTRLRAGERRILTSSDAFAALAASD